MNPDISNYNYNYNYTETPKGNRLLNLFRKIKKPEFNFRKKYLIIIVGALVLLITIIVYAFYQAKYIFPNPAYSESPTKIQGPTLTRNMNREFSFPLFDDSGKEVSKFKYTLDSVELRKEIVIQGQRATAIDGKQFVVINLKITNDYDKGIQVYAKDYIRFVVDNKNNELLAADIHNDPVEVQSKSTKYTRIGISAPENIKKLSLLVGEIKGNKTSIDISL